MVDEINVIESRKRARDFDDEVELFAIIFGFLKIILCSWHHMNYRVKEIAWCEHERVQKRKYWMNSLMNDRICREQLRMDINCFDKLCCILQVKGGLKTTRNVTVKEIVASFLHILGHDLKNRTIGAVYTRSGETISRHFHMVLKVVMKIGQYYIKQMDSTISFERDGKWKWFSGVVGALDGTHILMTVSPPDRPRYRDRDGHITTNVLATCDSRLRFSYVLTGWEGSASDQRVLGDALRRPNGLKLVRDKYYLVDLKKGNKAEGEWKPQAYQAVADELRATLGTCVTTDNVKNRIKSWKKHYANITDIRTFSKFKWDEERKMIVIGGEDLDQWHSFVQEHPLAAPYRNKAIEYWDDICTLYGPDRAIGDGVEMHDEAAMAMDEETESEGGSSNKSMSSSGSKKQKRDRLADAVTKLTECFSDYVQSKPKEIPKPLPEEVHEVVKNVYGIGRHQVMRAVKRFLNGPTNEFAMLKKLPDDEKLDWLLLCLND